MLKSIWAQRPHLNIFDQWDLSLTSKYQKSFYTVARQFMKYLLASSSCDALSASQFSVIIQKYSTGQKFGHIKNHLLSIWHFKMDDVLRIN